jgi:hypothetical protein
MNCRLSWGEGLKHGTEKGFVVSNMTLTHAYPLRHYAREVNPSVIAQSIFGHPIVFLLYHGGTMTPMHTVNSRSVMPNRKKISS